MKCTFYWLFVSLFLLRSHGSENELSQQTIEEIFKAVTIRYARENVARTQLKVRQISWALDSDALKTIV